MTGLPTVGVEILTAYHKSLGELVLTYEVLEMDIRAKKELMERLQLSALVGMREIRGGAALEGRGYEPVRAKINKLIQNGG